MCYIHKNMHSHKKMSWKSCQEVAPENCFLTFDSQASMRLSKRFSRVLAFMKAVHSLELEPTPFITTGVEICRFPASNKSSFLWYQLFPDCDQEAKPIKSPRTIRQQLGERGTDSNHKCLMQRIKFNGLKPQPKKLASLSNGRDALKLKLAWTGASSKHNQHQSTPLCRTRFTEIWASPLHRSQQYPNGLPVSLGAGSYPLLPSLQWGLCSFTEKAVKATALLGLGCLGICPSNGAIVLDANIATHGPLLITCPCKAYGNYKEKLVCPNLVVWCSCLLQRKGGPPGPLNPVPCILQAVIYPERVHKFILS